MESIPPLNKITALFILKYIDSARRPRHLSSTQEMYMKVIDKLSACRIAINNHPETGLPDILNLTYLIYNNTHIPYNVPVIFFQVIECRYMFFWKNQHMDRRLGVNVIKRKPLVILINNPAFYLPCYDLTEDT